MPDSDQKPPPDNGLRLDTKDWNLLYGDPKASTGGYFSGGIGEEGARWRTGNGAWDFSAHQSGLDSNLLLGENRLHLGGDFDKHSGSLSLNQGEPQLFDLYGGVSDLDNWNLGLRNQYQLGGSSGSLSPSLEYGDKKGEGYGAAKLDWKGDGFAANASGTLSDAGLGLGLGLTNQWGNATVGRGMNLTLGDNPSVANTMSYKTPTDSASFSQSMGPKGDNLGMNFDHQLGGGSSFGGGFNLGHDAKGNETDAFKLRATWGMEGGASLNANGGLSTGPNGNAYDLGIGYSDKANKFNLAAHDGGAGDRSLTGGYGYDANGTKFNLDMGVKEGKDGTSLNLNQMYGDKDFAERAKLNAGISGQTLSGSGQALGRLSDDWYLGGYGDFGIGAGKPTTWDAGGSLTYMAGPHIGITAGAGYGSEGYEGRLQADYYKKKVTGAGALLPQMSDPAFSAFIGVSSGAGAGAANAMGTPDWQHQIGSGTGPSINAGVGWSF